MGLLDDSETDWKIIVIDIHGPLAPKLNDIGDVEKYCPGAIGRDEGLVPLVHGSRWEKAE
jgi:inorganic pyrophosphatase